MSGSGCFTGNLTFYLPSVQSVPDGVDSAAKRNVCIEADRERFFKLVQEGFCW